MIKTESEVFHVGDVVWGDIGSNAKLGSNANVTTKELGAYAEYAVALDTQLALAPTDSLPALELCGLPKVSSSPHPLPSPRAHHHHYHHHHLPPHTIGHKYHNDDDDTRHHQPTNQLTTIILFEGGSDDVQGARVVCGRALE